MPKKSHKKVKKSKKINKSKNIFGKDQKDIDKIFNELNKNIKSLISGSKKQKLKKGKKLKDDLKFLFNNNGSIDLDLSINKMFVKKIQKKTNKKTKKKTNKKAKQYGGYIHGSPNTTEGGNMMVYSMMMGLIRSFLIKFATYYIDRLGCDRFVEDLTGDAKEALKANIMIAKDLNKWQKRIKAYGYLSTINYLIGIISFLIFGEDGSNMMSWVLF